MILSCVWKKEHWAEEWNTIRDVRIISIVYASLGVADATCALIEYDDGEFVVGVGNPGRPYEQLYQGIDWEQAARVFIRWCYPWTSMESAEDDPVERLARKEE